MTLEVRIPISPTPSFLNRVRLIADSILEFYPDATMTVSCYPTTMPGGVGRMPVRWRFVAEDDARVWRGTANEHVATMADRYRPPFYGDHVLMLDADVLCMDRFDELFDMPGLSGVQAHVPPFSWLDWMALYHRCGIPSDWKQHEFSGFGIMYHSSADRFGPSYLNTGVVFGPAEVFVSIHDAYVDMLHKLRGWMNSYFFEQVALTLAAAKCGVPINVLPMRYNFPNQAVFDHGRPAELEAVRFLHFLRADIVDRDCDFENPQALDRLCSRADLTGSNEKLRLRLMEIRQHDHRLVCPR